MVDETAKPSDLSSSETEEQAEVALGNSLYKGETQ